MKVNQLIEKLTKVVEEYPELGEKEVAIWSEEMWEMSRHHCRAVERIRWCVLDEGGSPIPVGVIEQLFDGDVICLVLEYGEKGSW